MTKPRAARPLMVASACLQNFLCGGLIFGWAAISSSLLISDQGGAGLGRAFVSHLFVIATSVNFTAPLLLGILLDHCGPRICSVVSIFLVAAGFFLFAVSSSAFPAFLPAIVLIAFGGPGVQSSIIHLSNLYPNHKATVTSVITGSFNLSFIVFFVFDRLWSLYGLTYRVIFMSYGFICVFALTISLALWPDKPFEFTEQLQELHEPLPDQKSKKKVGPIRAPSVFIKRKAPPKPTVASSEGAKPASGVPGKNETTVLLGGPAVEEVPDVPDTNASLWEQLKSPAFLRVTFFIVVGSFWANFYIGTIDIQLADLNFLSQQEQFLMVRLFTGITTAGVLGIPLVGRLMDKLGYPVTAIVTITMAVLFGVGVLWSGGGLSSLILAFIAYALFRTFLFTYFFAYLAHALGFRYFGVLAGVAFLCAGCAGLLQSPLMELGAGTCHLSVPAKDGCFEGRWESINWVQLACLCALYIIPYFDSREEAQLGKKPGTPRKSPGIRYMKVEGQHQRTGGASMV